MPILLVFLLTAACLPVEWPAPPLGLDPFAGVGLTGVAVLLPLTAALVLRTWVIRSLDRDPTRRAGVVRVYARLRRLLFFVNVGAVVLAVVGLGWGWTVQHALTIPWGEPGDEILAPFAELAVPLPYFLILAGCWLLYYDAERALHRASAADRARPFWSRPAYFAHQLRQLALLVALPVGLFVTQQSLARVAPELARADWYRLASFAVVPAAIVFLPLLIKPLLGLRPLPPGPVRDRIEALARRLHFRYTDLLVWPTHNSATNAMIVGLVPRIRYVIFTDRLIEELPADELDAVFGHEVGHARHGHIWFYALFLALSMTVLAALLLLLAREVTVLAEQNPQAWYARLTHEDAWWLALPPVGLAAGYVFLVFGFLSRRCERQADVFGCRAGSCANPNCTGHDAATVFPERGDGLCPTGIRACVRALERVYHLNGYDAPAGLTRRTLRDVIRDTLELLRAWLHAPIPRRVAFLLSLIDDPGRERRFQRRVRLLRVGLVLGLVAALAALGEAVGWRSLLAAM